MLLTFSYRLLYYSSPLHINSFPCAWKETQQDKPEENQTLTCHLGLFLKQCKLICYLHIQKLLPLAQNQSSTIHFWQEKNQQHFKATRKLPASPRSHAPLCILMQKIRKYVFPRNRCVHDRKIFLLTRVPATAFPPSHPKVWFCWT